VGGMKKGEREKKQYALKNEEKREDKNKTERKNGK
jgi:hypothetical protein